MPYKKGDVLKKAIFAVGAVASGMAIFGFIVASIKAVYEAFIVSAILGGLALCIVGLITLLVTFGVYISCDEFVQAMMEERKKYE